MVTIFKCLELSRMEEEMIWPQRAEPGLCPNALGLP